MKSRLLQCFKRKRSKVVSGLALAMAILCSSHAPNVFADSVGGGGVIGSGGGSGTSSATGQMSTMNAVGYRIYFTSGEVCNLENNKWNNPTGYFFAEARKYAIYEFCAIRPDESSYVGTRTIRVYDGRKFTTAYYELGGMNKKNKPEFYELFKNTNFAPDKIENKLEPFDYDASGKVFRNFEKWSEEVVGGVVKDKAQFEKFLSNYKKILSKDGVDVDKLCSKSVIPSDYDDFTSNNWAIVIEPLLITAPAGTGGAGYAISAQDVGEFKSSGADTSWIKNKLEVLNTVFTQFKSKKHKMDINSNKTSNGKSYTGFIMFFGLDQEEDKAKTNISSGYNLVVYANKPITSNGTSVTRRFGSTTTGYSSKDGHLRDALGNSTYKDGLKSFVKADAVDQGVLTKSNLLTVGNKWRSNIINKYGIAGADKNTSGSADIVGEMVNGSASVISAYNDQWLIGSLGNLSDSEITSLNSGVGYEVAKVESFKLTIPKGKKFKVSNLSVAQADISSQINAVTIKNTSSAVSGDGKSFGSKFGYTLQNASGVANAVKSQLIANGISGVSSANNTSFSSSHSGDKVNNQDDAVASKKILGKLLGSTVNAGKLSVEYLESKEKELTTTSDGNVYCTVSLVVPRTKVTSHIAGIGIGDNNSSSTGKVSYKNTSRTGGITNKSYLVQSSASHTINKSSISSVGSISNSQGGNFLIVWKNSDSTSTYNLNNIAGLDKIRNGIISKLNSGSGLNFEHYIAPSNAGATVLGNAFKSATGITPVSTTFIGKGSGISQVVNLGSVAKSDGSLDGYSVLVVSADAFDVPAVSTASLKEYELNYIFPNLLGESSSIPNVVSMQHNKATTIKTVSNPANSTGVVKHLGANGIYYNSNLPTFAKYATTSKNFAANTSIKVSHAFNLPRGIFNDKVNVSSFRNNLSSDVESYIKNVLKLGVGVKGSSDILSGGAGKKVKSSELHDEYKWTAYEGTTQLSAIFNYSSYMKANSAWYRVKEYCTKYTATDISNTSKVAESTAYSKSPAEGNVGYKFSTTTSSNKTLSFYPEVGMVMHLPSGVSNISNPETIKGLSQSMVYVMGDKVRSLTPSALRLISIKSSNGAGAVSGDITSSTFATDSDAMELSKSMGGLPVIYAGGDINMKSKVNAKVDLVSYALDITESDDSCYADITRNKTKTLKSDFSKSNSAYTPLNEFERWTDSIKNGVSVDVTLDVKDGNRLVESYSDFNTGNGKYGNLGKTSSEAYPLVFKNGELDKSAEGYTKLVKKIAEDYEVSNAEAEELINKAGFEKQIKGSVESRNSASNKSESMTFNGKTYTKWYDEETTVFVVRRYHREMAIGDVSVSDKLDITSGPSGDAHDSSNLFGKGYKANWTLSVELDESLVSDSMTKVLNKVKVNGADFIIPSATTSDMRTY